MNVTPWPMKTLSSMVTPSQTKVWLETLQRLPILAFFCTSTNAPIFVSSPTSQPYRLMNLDSFTSRPSFTSAATQRYEFPASLLRPCLLFFMRGAELFAKDHAVPNGEIGYSYLHHDGAGTDWRL